MRKLKNKNDLLIYIDKLTGIQIHLLTEMAESLHKKIIQYIDPKSDILTPDFIDDFINRLKIHHATHAECFKKKSFEYAFESASINTGKKAKIVDSETYPGADVIVDDTSYSLKTEASKGIKKDYITISKLMEARWIRECVSRQDFARETKIKIVGHLEKYERILILRAFKISRNEIKYDLIEIPKSVLMNIRNLTQEDFEERTKNGSNCAIVKCSKDGKKYNYKLRLDGSVEKVTISGLPTELCRLHGSWTLTGVQHDTD